MGLLRALSVFLASHFFPSFFFIFFSSYTETGWEIEGVGERGRWPHACVLRRKEEEKENCSSGRRAVERVGD